MMEECMVWTCEDNVAREKDRYALPECYRGNDYRMRPRDSWDNSAWFEFATPCEMQEHLSDHGVLGLKRSASQEEIRQAYRAKARATHPDKGGDHDEFIKVQKAYENLCKGS